MKQAIVYEGYCFSLSSRTPKVTSLCTLVWEQPHDRAMTIDELEQTQRDARLQLDPETMSLLNQVRALCKTSGLNANQTSCLGRVLAAKPIVEIESSQGIAAARAKSQ